MQSGPVETLFAYDGWRMLGEYDTTGLARQETVWLGDLPIATLQNSATYYIYPDHLGTPRVITNTANTILWRWDSEPFGSTAANEDPDNNGVKFTYNPRFPGQYFDAETGKHYNYFRDYDPGTGRYIESDPVGLGGGLNIYLYVNANPLLLIDPLGLCSCVAAPEVKAKDDLHQSQWWGHKRKVTCTYRCTHNGKTEYVEGTHTESYILHWPADDVGNEGDCIGAFFEEVYESGWSTGRFVKRRLRYDSFNPSDSDSEGLRNWAKENCEDCEH